MRTLTKIVIAAMLVSLAPLTVTRVEAQTRRDRRDRIEDRWDRREDVRDRREDRRDARFNGGVRDRREDRRDRREDRRDLTRRPPRPTGLSTAPDYRWDHGTPIGTDPHEDHGTQD